MQDNLNKNVHNSNNVNKSIQLNFFHSNQLIFLQRKVKTRDIQIAN